MKIHLSLPVYDVELAEKFYTQLFDSKPSKIKTDYIKYEPEQLPLNISFHNTEKTIDTDRHLGIQFESQQQLDQAYERLQQAGLTAQEKETSICCYARQDKFWVKDSVGYEWELYYLLEDTDIKIESNTNCCANNQADTAACC